jgi:tetratricopeptide (TPR) repeat protein
MPNRCTEAGACACTLGSSALDASGESDDVLVAARIAADQLARGLGLAPIATAAAEPGLDALLQKVESATLNDRLDDARALLAQATAAQRESPEVRLRLAHIDYQAGNLPAAEAAFAAIAKEVPAEQDPVLHARALTDLGVLSALRNDNTTAASRFDEAIALLRGRAAPDALGKALNGRANVAGAMDQAELALQAFAEARGAFERSGNLLALALVDSNLAALDMRRERYAEALPVFQRAAERFATFGMHAAELNALSGAAELQLALLEPDAALATEPRLRELAAAVADPARQRNGELTRLYVLAANGHTRDAATAANTVLDLARRDDDESAQARAQALLARLALAQGDAAAAIEASTQSLAHFPAADDVREEARAGFLHVEALLAGGRAADAARSAADLTAFAAKAGDAASRLYADLAQARTSTDPDAAGTWYARARRGRRVAHSGRPARRRHRLRDVADRPRRHRPRRGARRTHRRLHRARLRQRAAAGARASRARRRGALARCGRAGAIARGRPHLAAGTGAARALKFVSVFLSPATTWLAHSCLANGFVRFDACAAPAIVPMLGDPHPTESPMTLPRFALPGATALFAAMFSTACLAADGQPDPNFGFGGAAYITPDDVEARELRPYAALALPDGKILVAGERNKFIPSSPFDPHMRAMIARLNADGSADDTFGNVPGIPGLFVLPDLVPDTGAGMQVIEAMQRLDDGSIIVAGTAQAFGRCAASSSSSTRKARSTARSAAAASRCSPASTCTRSPSTAMAASSSPARSRSTRSRTASSAASTPMASPTPISAATAAVASSSTGTASHSKAATSAAWASAATAASLSAATTRHTAKGWAATSRSPSSMQAAASTRGSTAPVGACSIAPTNLPASSSTASNACCPRLKAARCSSVTTSSTPARATPASNSCSAASAPMARWMRRSATPATASS